MRVFKRTMALILAVVLLISLCVIPAYADTPPVFEFTSDATAPKAGETFTMTLTLSQEVLAVGALDAYLTYDTDTLEVVSKAVGASGGVLDEMLTTPAAPGNTVKYTASAVDYENGDTVPAGVIFTATFKVKDSVEGIANIPVGTIKEFKDGTSDMTPIAYTAIMNLYTQTVTVAAPVKGVTPQNTITEATGYTGAITWNPSATPFAASTAYTAHVVLTAKTGYKFASDATGSVTGATISNPVVASDGSTLSFDAAFPPTASRTLTGITLSPSTSNEQYAVGDTALKGGVTVTADYDDSSSAAVTGYTLSGLTKDATSLTVSYTEGVVTETADLTLTQAVRGATKTAAELYTFTDPNLTYTGSDQISAARNAAALKTGVIAAEVGTPTFSFEKTVSGSWQSVTSVTDAGSYRILVTTTGGTAYEAITTAQPISTFTVAAKALTAADFTVVATKPYTGSAVDAGVTTSLTPTDDYTVSGASTLTDVASADQTITFKGVGNYTGTVTKTWNLTPVSVTITGVTAENKPYDGTVAATAAGTAAVSGKIGSDDVTVTAGTAAFNTPYVGLDKPVTFSDYSLGGSKAGNYRLASQPATVNADITPVADPAVIKNTATVTKDGNQVDLSENVTRAQGEVAYAFSDGSNGCTIDAATGMLTSGPNAGAVTVTVIVAPKDVSGDGTNEYTGTSGTIAVTISDKSTNTADMTVSQSGCTFGETLEDYVLTGKPSGAGADTVLYTGTLRDGSTTYSSATKPTQAGTYKVSVQCETATVIYKAESASFTIAPKSIAGAAVELGTALTYTGASQTQTVTSVVKDGTVPAAAYELSNNTGTNAGQYTLTVAAKTTGNYTGAVAKSFPIAPKSITPAVTVTGTYAFTGSAVTPTYTVKDGATALAASDYTAAFGANVNAGTDAGSVTITAKDSGNYTFPAVTTAFDIGKAAAQTIADQTVSQKFSVTAEQSKLVAGLMPANAGTLTYTKGSESETGTVTVSRWSVDAASGLVKYTLTGGAVGAIVTLPVTIGSDNYADSTVNVKVTLTDKDVPDVTAGDISVTYTGSAVPASAITGTATFNGTAVPGTWSWKAIPAQELTTVANSGPKIVVFTPDNTDAYAAVEKTITLTIAKATPTGAPTYAAINVSGKTLLDAALTAGTIAPAGGAIAWDLGDTATVTANASYAWTYTPADPANYNNLTGSITPYVVSYGGGSVVSNCTLTFQTNGGSAITAISKTSGTTVDLASYQPTRDGYTFAGWFSDAALTVAVTSVKLTADTTVYAKWTRNAVNPFTDVPDGAYYHDAVLWALGKNVTDGTTPATFSPAEHCTRAQVVTFLWRAMGSPEPAGKTNPFTDVSPDAYYYKAVLWAVEQGITKGTSDTAFSPDETVTRAQFVTFLWRAASLPTAGGTNPFADVTDPDMYYYQAVLWAAEQGVTDGTTPTAFNPGGACNRGQVVTFLYRYLGK